MKTELTQSLDFSPLEERVSPVETIQVIKTEVMSSKIALVFLVLFVLFFLNVVGLIMGTIFATSRVPIAVPHFLALGFFFIIPILILSSFYGWARDQIRFKRFAQRNQFDYAEAIENPGLEGAIFQTGSDRRITNHIKGVFQGYPFWAGNYSYTVSSGKNSTTYTYGVVAVELQRALPHTLLDARKNNFLSRVSNLPSTFSRDQRLQLEGDFGKYFDLYAPKKYERDILYFLTPELMALLIDKGADYDIEIIDNNLFIYHQNKLQATVDDVRNVFELIHHIGGEISENTQRYADERVGSKQANIVALQGKRLQQVNTGFIIFILFICYILFVASR